MITELLRVDRTRRPKGAKGDSPGQSEAPPWVRLGEKQGRTLNLPASGPCAEKKPIRLVCAYIVVLALRALRFLGARYWWFTPPE